MPKYCLRLTYFVASLLLPAIAYAHAPVISTSIEQNTMLETAPEKFAIEFGGKVGLAALIIKDESGSTLNEGVKLPRTMQSNFEIPLPPLSSGAYTIEWRTMSTDGHVMTGHLVFKVK